MIFAALQMEEIIKINVEVVCLDGTTVKVHPDGTGALKEPWRKKRKNGYPWVKGKITGLILICVFCSSTIIM